MKIRVHNPNKPRQTTLVTITVTITVATTITANSVDIIQNIIQNIKDSLLFPFFERFVFSTVIKESNSKSKPNRFIGQVGKFKYI